MAESSQFPALSSVPQPTTTLHGNFWDNLSDEEKIHPFYQPIDFNSPHFKDVMEKFYGRLERFQFPHCRDVDTYEKLQKIGQGTFGEVFKGRERKTKKLVAMKKIKMEQEKEGFPITAIREIKILKGLKCDNIVRLIEVCRTKPNSANRHRMEFYLIFEFCYHDLAGLLSNDRIRFTLPQIKSILKQILHGLYFIHSNNILHRDMKAANILITKTGVVKLADFGLARTYQPPRDGNHPNRYTSRVVTLWYRPPELLLGERNYGPAMDMWGTGCIMTELWTRTPLMQGDTEPRQLSIIVGMCGSITNEVWPGVNRLELFDKLNLETGKKRILKERLRLWIRDDHALDLIDKLLTYDPSKRLDADAALDHDFFYVSPKEEDLSRMMANLDQSHYFEYLAPRRSEALGRQHNSVMGTASAAGHVHQHRANKPAPDMTFDRIF